MSSISAEFRNAIRLRALDQCEYCKASQNVFSFFRFQIEHVVARQHGGETIASNLAWACQHCNLHKGPNLSGIDPQTGKVTLLFHPRLQIWNDHFEIAGPMIIGRTAVGRTSARVLNMNTPRRIELRSLHP